MTMACDENIKKWDCVVLLKLDGEFDIFEVPIP